MITDKIVKIYDTQLSPLIVESLSLSPDNKTNVLRLDNLPGPSKVRIQHTIVKNLNEVNNTIEKGKRSSSLVLDNVDTVLDSISTENKILRKIQLHNEAQVYIGQIIDELKDLVKKYPHFYQAQLADACGLTKLKLNDNNYVVATLFDIAISQNIMTKYHMGIHAHFMIKEDKPYKPIEYIEQTGYASGLEAKIGNYLIKNNFNFQQQVKIEGNKRIDFLVDVNGQDLFVEVHGRQHYFHTPHFHRTDHAFADQQYRDQAVSDYMFMSDCEYVELPYDKDIVKLLQTKISDMTI